MKKITQSDYPSAIQISLNDSLNPEQSENRCKICFEQKMPLVTLCECTGSIAYVHEDCILDWIALKMQKSELIEIPKCEICKSKFSAALKIGSKKIDTSLLVQKVKSTSKKDWATFTFTLVSFFVAFTSITMALLSVATLSAFSFQSFGSFLTSLIQVIFIQMAFPAFFMKEITEYFKQKWRILDACKVQLVEVTLLPKKILKS